MEFAETTSEIVGYIFLVPVFLALVVVILAMVAVYLAGAVVYLFGRGVGFILGSVIDGVIYPFRKKA